LMPLRISYQPFIPQYLRDEITQVTAEDLGDMWVHIDYFQDRITKEPKLFLLSSRR
jgi:hypothetical protein